MNQNNRLTDISAELSSLRAAHPQLREATCSIILRYKPNSAALAGAWAEVRPFTITTAAEMAPDTFDVTRRLMTMTAQFHIWAWSRTGTDLNVPVVYTQNNIDRFLSTHLKHRSPHHRWGVSRQLVKVGRELADADLIALPAPNGKVRAPFAPKQIATMHSWANALTTVKKRQNAYALLGLAGGAGLTAAEIVETRITDIIRVDNVVLIKVREGKSRLVPVRHAWARVLLRSIEGREHTNEHLFRGHRFEEYPPRTIQTFLTDHPAKVRPTPSLLRNSWILHHINNDVPPQALMEASGLDCFQTLGRYYEHAQARKLSDYTSMFVGAEATR